MQTTTAEQILATVTDMESVATYGYKGELPEGLSETERFELLNAIQDAAKAAVD